MKKKIVKKAVAKRPPRKKIDSPMVFENANSNGAIILALEDLRHHPGWKILTQLWDQNVADLEQSIIYKMQGEVALSDIEVDRLRDKLGYLRNVIETPNKYVIMLRRSDTPPKNFDPYAVDVKEID